MSLTKIEFALLHTLANQAGSIISGEELGVACWGRRPGDDRHLVSVHIANIRRKIDPDGSRLQTIRGMGYRLVPSSDLSPT